MVMGENCQHGTAKRKPTGIVVVGYGVALVIKAAPRNIQPNPTTRAHALNAAQAPTAIAGEATLNHCN